MPSLDIQLFENYGPAVSPSFLSEEQKNALDAQSLRVNAQLDWIAQLLGWNGPDYWGKLALSISDKRKLLNGSFGIYGFKRYPVVRELRNWDFTILVENDPSLQIGQRLVCGSYSTTISNIEEEGQHLSLHMENNKEEIFETFSNNQQLYVETPNNSPSPFFRPEVENSADFSFHVSSIGQELTLSPIHDTEGYVPFSTPIFLIKGSVLRFDAPVFFSSKGNLEVEFEPTYIPEEELWQLRVPADRGRKLYLVAPHSNNAKAECHCLDWEDPSDWLTEGIKDSFFGVWSQKGGELPLHYVFDSLGVHGFSYENSLVLEPVSTELEFNKLLDFVYYKTAKIGEATTPSEVWWDPYTGSFYVWNGTESSCSPWVEADLPNNPSIHNHPDYIFKGVSDFLEQQEGLPVGTKVKLISANDVGLDSGVIGISGTLSGYGSIMLWKQPEGNYWSVVEVRYNTVSGLNTDEAYLPYSVPVVIFDATGLGTDGVGVEVVNLGIEIDRPVEVKLVKVEGDEKWHILRNNLKYVGETRLFGADSTPIDGELIETGDRTSIYYYNRWVPTYPSENTDTMSLTDEGTADNYIGVSDLPQDGDNPVVAVSPEVVWVLEGDWIDTSTGENTDPPSALVDYSALKVYCNSTPLVSGESISTDDYFFAFTVDEETGKLLFEYSALSTLGRVELPTVEITDSITSAFRYDISEYVFSGAAYKVVPDLRNSEIPLRVYKEEPLMVCSDPDLLAQGMVKNPFLAGDNCGPASENQDKYSVRLPLEYGRESSQWARTNQVCESFSYWGTRDALTNLNTEDNRIVPEIYEDLVMRSQDPSKFSYVYSEPYLFSGLDIRRTSYSEAWDNSALLPASPHKDGLWSPSRLEPYDPMANRRVDSDGDWIGTYSKVFRCNNLSGFFWNDYSRDAMEILEPPVWDASIYKYPTFTDRNKPSLQTSPNNYRVQYALFIAGQSVAGDCVFDLREYAG